MFTFSERPLGRLAFGNVNDRSEYHEPLISLDRVQADLDREFATVLLAGEEIAPGSHWARPRLGEKTRAHFRMTTAEPFGDEHFYPLPQKLSARILKYPLGLSIHQDNLARSVNHHYGVRRRLDDQPKARLGGYLLVGLMVVVGILAITRGLLAPISSRRRPTPFPLRA